MSQGLYSSVTGIKANQTKMDVIADNISNLNTVAFKGSNVNFATLFNQTIKAGTAPSGNVGGTNPKQIGQGVKVADITRDFSQGNVQTTGRPTDLNIQGQGFFALQDPTSSGTTAKVFLTRAGNFSLDASGVLTNPDGYKVLGTDDVSGRTAATTEFVTIPTSLNVQKTIVAPPGVSSVTIDTPIANSTNNVTVQSFNVQSDGAIEVTYSNGDRISVTSNAAVPPNRVLVYYPSEGGTIGSGQINVDNDAITPSNLQIQMATVANPTGLIAQGNNIYTAGVNSGNPNYTIGSTNGCGLIDAGALETSNVDLTREFASMMVTQRVIEANSRSFNAQNSILETIINMAR